MFRRPWYIDRDEADFAEKFETEDRGNMSLEEFYEKNATPKLKAYHAYLRELNRRAKERGVRY